MASYKVKITGISPLLLHRDNIEMSDELKVWRQDPDNKKISVAGDDRSPAFTWLSCLYFDDEKGNLNMPSDNIMRCLMEGGAMVPVPGGKNGKTFKAQTQSGMVVRETGWDILVKGDPIPVKDIFELKKEKDFIKHRETVQEYGFSLYVKRAAVGQSKHVRVRPKFFEWELNGNLDVWDEQITTPILTQIFYNAGQYKGLGDWRPSGKTPGSYGRFDAEIKEA